MAKLSIETPWDFELELDYGLLRQLTDPVALLGWENALKDDLSRGEYRDIHAFSFGAGAGIVSGLQAGSKMEEMVWPFVNMAKETLGEDYYHEGLGAMVELWNFGGEFFEICQKQGFEWCDKVQLTSQRMGKYQSVPAIELPELVSVVENKKSSIDVA